MSMRDGLRTAADRLRLVQAERRADVLERRGHRLSEQLSTLKTELDHEREGRQELANLLQRKENEMGKGHPMLRMLVVGGAAYVLGAKAGRGRYEQIMEKGRELRARFGAATEPESDGRTTASSPNAMTSHSSTARA